jgi:hypothetical protein
MYQSPVAAIAELVANAWDADTESVEISLPDRIDADATIVIRDRGSGMTFAQCEDRFLNVGYCRRAMDAGEMTAGGRPILGRKGIGKFAGFGIAGLMVIETVSKDTGEKTVFELDVDRLRSEEYIVQGGEIAVTEHIPPDPALRDQHGTRITLKRLTLKRRHSPEVFGKSMARRFLLLNYAENFRITVNGRPIPTNVDTSQIEFIFPRDYTDDEKPAGLTVGADGWATETIGADRRVSWKVVFFKETIEDEELRGISIFAKVKLAQRPFFFNLTGGLGAQHAQEYMSGQVRADFIDLLEEDIIATERQRINWEHEESVALEAWGQGRVKQLMQLWKKRRGEKRQQQINDRVEGFSSRLHRLPSHERRTVERALRKLGGVASLSEAQFTEIATAVLTSWEQGRLRALIDNISEHTDIDPQAFLALLLEAEVLVALNVAEAVKTKLEAIRGLRRFIEAGNLENAVRDVIAEKPYLLHPKWETFRKEVSLKRFLEEAAAEAGLDDDGDDAADIGEDARYERKRIDLALRSGEHLLVVEFMKPGKTADYDHLSRCRAYIHTVREKLEAETELGIRRVTGLIVPDRLSASPIVRREIPELAKTEIYAYTWESLLQESENVWREFLGIIKERAPDDDRLGAL